MDPLLLVGMVAAYPMELPVNSDVESALQEGEPLPEALHAMMMKSSMSLLCSFALWSPDFQDHWTSLQSDKAFKSEKTMMCSILGIITILGGILIALSGGFKATSSTDYFNYTSPTSYLALFATFMFAFIAILMSSLSAISWLHADRHYAQKQLKQGGFCVVFYLLSIVAPMFFVALSLICFICATLIAGFCSQSTVGRVVAELLLVICAIIMILMGLVRKSALDIASSFSLSSP
ncbi:hypothetical protein EDB19DRAFT_1912396 [Suillus lakei]|nr:hypothetical protein EDB19DRAFT_1912396 [Suillus lakei]